MRVPEGFKQTEVGVIPQDWSLATLSSICDVSRNDILMSMIGTIGNCALIDFEPYFCIKNIALIKPKNIEEKYLFQFLLSCIFEKYISRKLDGGIQQFVSLGVLRKLEIPLPPTRAEQTA